LSISSCGEVGVELLADPAETVDVIEAVEAVLTFRG
jgi:hypothetical protein